MNTSVIVPAYNEEKYIGRVLDVLNRSIDSIIQEAIVVNDGSTDTTKEVAMLYPRITLLSYQQNKGKANALYEGFHASTGDIVMFLDSDLTGLKERHLEDLIAPIQLDNADFTYGVFSIDWKKPSTWKNLGNTTAPAWTGQRAMKREVLNAIHLEQYKDKRFAIDALVMKYAEDMHFRIEKVRLDGLSQVLKEQKRGLFRGFSERMRMYREIFRNSS